MMKNMSSTLYAGCSLTAGYGFDGGKNDPALWVNILHQTFDKLQQTKLINVGIAGASNFTIFKTVFDYICKQDDLQFVFVEWTSVPRYNLNPALETYHTSIMFIPDLSQGTLRSHNVTYDGNYLQGIQDRFLSLLNDHYEIVDLLRYVNWINTMCNLKNIKVFHVNGICPWDKNYFKRLSNTKPSQLTDYTQHLLQVTTRDDKEIFEIYNKMHQDYDDVGGIQTQTWLNLYQPLTSLAVDTNNDNQHPGVESHQKFAKLLETTLDSVL
jgi:hypothetical protein